MKLVLDWASRGNLPFKVVDEKQGVRCKNMEKLDLNNNIDAAIFIWREAVCNKPNAVKYICKFLNPGDFSAWLLRYLQGDKSAQDEAVAAFVASFEKWQEAGEKDEELFYRPLKTSDRASR